MEVEWTLGFAIAEIVPTIFSDYTPLDTPPPLPPSLDDEYTISSLTDTDADTGSESIDDIEHTIEVPIVYLDEVEEEAVESTEQQQQQESVAYDGDELGQVPAQEEEGKGEAANGIEEVVEEEVEEEEQVNTDSDASGEVSEDVNTIEHVIDPVSDEAVAVESTAQEEGHNSDRKVVDLNPRKVQKPFLLNILTSIIQIPVYLFTLVYKLLTLPLSLLLTTR